MLDTNRMGKLTTPLESATRKKIDNWLKDLGWNIDEENKNCNVFTERAKTKEQNKKFKRKKPDYVLYKSGTDEPLAIIEAKKKGAKTIGLLGNDGGIMKEIVEIPIIVNSSSAPRIQEVHRVIYHIICEMVEKELSKQ